MSTEHHAAVGRLFAFLSDLEIFLKLNRPPEPPENPKGCSERHGGAPVHLNFSHANNGRSRRRGPTVRSRAWKQLHPKPQATPAFHETHRLNLVRHPGDPDGPASNDVDNVLESTQVNQLGPVNDVHADEFGQAEDVASYCPEDLEEQASSVELIMDDLDSQPPNDNPQPPDPVQPNEGSDYQQPLAQPCQSLPSYSGNMLGTLPPLQSVSPYTDNLPVSLHPLRNVSPNSNSLPASPLPRWQYQHQSMSRGGCCDLRSHSLLGCVTVTHRLTGT